MSNFWGFENVLFTTSSGHMNYDALKTPDLRSREDV